jgi:hypothetical protein
MHLINEGQVQDSAKATRQYKEALNEIITPDVFFNLINGDRDDLLKYIVATIHTVSYHLVHNFPVILFVNDKTLNAYPMIFEDTDIKTKFIDTFNAFKTNPFTFAMALDATSATGISIDYKV